MSWKVDFLRTAGGREPIAEFLDSLSVKERTKALRVIRLLEEFGPRLGMPHGKPIAGNLRELRAVFGGKAIRLFYTKLKDEYIILHGFIKKSQKTPTKEIKTADERLNLIKRGNL